MSFYKKMTHLGILRVKMQTERRVGTQYDGIVVYKWDQNKDSEILGLLARAKRGCPGYFQDYDWKSNSASFSCPSPKLHSLKVIKELTL